MKDLADSPLGRAVVVPARYDPGALHAVLRTPIRARLPGGIPGRMFGADLWRAWELSWLDRSGRPRAAVARLVVPADSRAIVESKSFKLYLNSFAGTRFAGATDVAAVIRNDLARQVGAEVECDLIGADRSGELAPIAPEAIAVDECGFTPAEGGIDPARLRADPRVHVRETLRSDVFRSLCPVTGQPDWGSIFVRYEGARIDPAGLFAYLAGYRQESGFHEACVERIFVELRSRCAPDRLAVQGCFLRRGGLDINPFRSSDPDEPCPHIRTWRQ